MRIRRWTCGLLLVTVGACASQHSSTAAPQGAPSAQTAPSGGGAHCPMMIDPATTQVSTADTSDGVAVTFTTTADVNALRAHVREMAAMHDRVAERHGAQTGSGMHGRGMHMRMVPSHATAEDVPGGARLLLVPSDPAQVASLRQHVRMHAEMMQKGECPMMAQPTQPPGAPHEQHHPSGA